jgi:hypothetical protein
MKRYLSVFTALALSLMSSAFAPSLKASEVDDKTMITINQPVSVDGTVLPAGRYVLKLSDSFTKDIVFIYNGDETRLIATVLAIHASRLQPTAKSAFSFYGMQEGQPAALHTWFYPGDNYGFEFVQRR